MQITATRLKSEAIEYVTGDTEARMTKAIMFWPKCTMPLRMKL